MDADLQAAERRARTPEGADPEASLETGEGASPGREPLLAEVYEELRRLAKALLARERDGHTLQATALVHEAWLRIAREPGRQFYGPAHFFRIAARAMERVLVDSARRRKAARRGGAVAAEEWIEERIASPHPEAEILAVHEALGELERVDAEAAEVVRLRYFAGMSVPEMARALELAPRSVDRSWAFARAWLKRHLRERESREAAAEE